MSTTPTTPQPTVEGQQQQLEATQQALQQAQTEGVAAQPTAKPEQKFVVETSTGQRFIGQTQADVIAEMQKSIENASSELKRLHEAEKQRNAPPPPTLTPEQQQEQQAQKWMLDQVAVGLGFTNAEDMKQAVGGMRQTSEQVKQQQVIAEFHARNDDFPANDAAADAITKIMEENGWALTVNNLSAAHVLAKHRGMYQGASSQQQSATNPAPPPVPPQGVPAPTFNGKRAEDMSANELRALIERGGQ
jgi:hypothetical protein